MQRPNHTERTVCRICEGEWGQDNPILHPFANLGDHPLADRFPRSVNEQEPTYPLRVKVCDRCRLVQHTDIVDDAILFGNDYAFFTGASPSSIAYFKQYAQDVMSRYPDKLAFVVEIAGNDGTLLKHFQKKAARVLNIEPATPPAEVAKAQGIPTLVKPFSLDTGRVLSQEQEATLVIANNVVAHTDKLLDFLAGINALLSEDGVCIAEVQYLPHLLFNTAFDHLYHEHRSFFSLHALQKACWRVNLVIVDVEEADTQGGSIRVHVKKASSYPKPRPAVEAMLARERSLGLLDGRTYQGFQARVNYTCQKLVQQLQWLKMEGFTIQGFGASAKGNTLLNTAGIGPDLLDCIVDLTPYKIGTYAPGSKIPIKHPDEVEKPDYYLLLVWNYLEGVLERESAFREAGGRFIVPIPTPKII